MNNLTQIFKLLSDETRLRIIFLLYQEELCVCQISSILDITQPKVSKTMSKLRDLNLVNDKRVDKYIFYTLSKDNQLLLTILEDMNKSISNYQQLVTDNSRLKSKDQIINLCNINS